MICMKCPEQGNQQRQKIDYWLPRVRKKTGVGGYGGAGGREVIPKVFLVEVVCFKIDCGDDFTYL